MTYVYQPYPKAIYSPKGEMKIVKNEDEHMALLEKWTSPQDDGEALEKRRPGRPRKNP